MMKCGDCACLHNVLTSLEEGTLTIDKVTSNVDAFRLRILLAGGTFKNDHARMLHHLNRAVESSRLPSWERGTEFGKLDKKAENEPYNLCCELFFLLPYLYGDFAQEADFSQAHLSCAITGLAVERFRLANERFPSSLDELISAKLINGIPIDPFSGKPLRYRRDADSSIIFYSISEKGDRSHIPDAERQFGLTATCYEFRLWNATDRRPSPLPKTAPNDKKFTGG